MNPLIISLLLFIALLSVSSSAIIVRYLTDLHALPIAFGRMLFAGMMLWSYSLVRPQGSLSIPNRKRTLFAGVFLGFHFALFFSAVKMTTLANATLYGTLAPVFTVLIEKLFFNYPMSRHIIIGLTLAIAGGVIIQESGMTINSVSFWGDMAAIFCSFWMAIVLLITKKVRNESGTIGYSRTVYITAAVTLLVLCWFFSEPVRIPTSTEFVFLLVLGFVPNILGHSILYHSIKFLPSSTVASVPLGEPVIVSLFGWFLFGEHISVHVIIGGLIVLTGLAIIIRNSKMDSEDEFSAVPAAE